MMVMWSVSVVCEWDGVCSASITHSLLLAQPRSIHASSGGDGVGDDVDCGDVNGPDDGADRDGGCGDGDVDGSGDSDVACYGVGDGIMMMMVVILMVVMVCERVGLQCPYHDIFLHYMQGVVHPRPHTRA